MENDFFALEGFSHICFPCHLIIIIIIIWMQNMQADLNWFAFGL